MSNIKILIVDDYEDNCELLEDIFEQQYQVKSVHSGKACLAILEEDPYDLVLLDVNMPEMDGYEVCKHIKQNAQTAMIPVIFVSALASTEERLKGYEYGAEEYVTKPFKEDDITQTVSKVLEQFIQAKNFEAQSKEAMSTAFQAMTNSAEMGQIIQYMQASYACKNVEKLAEALQQTLSGFGLNSCIMFRMQYQTSFFGCAKDSLEAKVLERFFETERIVNFGARTVINDNHVSLLIKNMPLDKPEDYGRLKDNLAALMSGTEARCNALEIEYQLDVERNLGLQSVLTKSRKHLQEIDKLIDHQKGSIEQTLIDTSQKVESIIFGLGLNETQEQSILAAIDKGVEELTQLTRYSDHIAKNFKSFVEELNDIAQQ